MKQFERSANGKYIYPVCSVTGLKTFARPDYFASVLAKKFGGSEERMVKEFVFREVKKYLDAGISKEEILDIIKRNKGKLPKLEPKISKEKIPKKERKKRLKASAVTKTTEVNSEGVTVEVVKKTYPWSEDPQHYFAGTPPSPLDVSLEKDSCHRPNYFLDNMCHGCPLYANCGFERKYGPEDYLDAKKNKRQSATVVKKLAAFTEEEIAAGNQVSA